MRDPSGGAVVGAAVSVLNLDTGYKQAQTTSGEGLYKLSLLPVGQYRITIEYTGFAKYQQQPVQLDVSRTVRVDIAMTLASSQESVSVESDAALMDTVSSTLGKVVTNKEILDLPLNGRNFTQLGLLQAGVAPMPAGLQQSGGSLRSGQGYGVNGQRPESNAYVKRIRHFYPGAGQFFAVDATRAIQWSRRHVRKSLRHSTKASAEHLSAAR